MGYVMRIPAWCIPFYECQHELMYIGCCLATTFEVFLFTCIYFQQLSNTVPTQLYDMNTLRLPLFRFGAFRRFTTSHPTNGATSDVAKSMSAWQINDYGGIDALELVNDIPVPPLSQPDDVLIEVKAASVNVLDVMMTGNLCTVEKT